VLVVSGLRRNDTAKHSPSLLPATLLATVTDRRRVSSCHFPTKALVFLPTSRGNRPGIHQLLRWSRRWSSARALNRIKDMVTKQHELQLTAAHLLPAPI
jgi:hypothetical protein